MSEWEEREKYELQNCKGTKKDKEEKQVPGGLLSPLYGTAKERSLRLTAGRLSLEKWQHDTLQY